MKKQINTQLSEITQQLSSFLISEVQSGKFANSRRFYADTFLATSLNFLDKEHPITMGLVESYLKQDIENDTHPEFNAYALQLFHNNKLAIVAFRQFFFRKVTNWVLLRSLVRVRQQNAVQRWIGISQAFIVTSLNRFDDYFTDNTLRMIHTKEKNISSQYHAFATLILGELYLETKISFFKSYFLNGLEIIKNEVEPSGKINMRGRGKQQIFGYASSAHALAIGYNLTKDKSLFHSLSSILGYIGSYQQKNGSIPLALVNNKQQDYWESYNNLYDYQAFLLLMLIQIKQKIN